MTKRYLTCFILKALAVIGLGVAPVFVSMVRAEDLYVNALAKSNGSGTSASPYWRITDAVVRARSDRNTNAIPATETITIHVAAGTYAGSFSTSGPHLEMLPIVVNVPNLVLQGSTVLTLDSCGLPTGAAKNAAQSIIVSKDELKDISTGLVIVTHTTDGDAGDRVTIAGFTVDPGGSANVNYHGIIADHVSQFTISGNLVQSGYLNVYCRFASGTIAGNVITKGLLGCFIEGGTGLFPSNVSVVSNRVNSNVEAGVPATDYATDLILNLGQSGLTALPPQFDGNDPDLPNGSVLDIRGNDLSNNRVGIRLFAAPIPFGPVPNLGPGMPTLTATISDNSIDNNQRYGLAIDGGDESPALPAYSGNVQVTLAGNSIVGSGIQPGLFTFYNYFDTIQGTHSTGHLEQAIYNITDSDGELTGFDYYNPAVDPRSSALLHNTLLVNGSQNILGIKLSFKP